MAFFIEFELTSGETKVAEVSEYEYFPEVLNMVKELIENNGIYKVHAHSFEGDIIRYSFIVGSHIASFNIVIRSDEQLVGMSLSNSVYETGEITCENGHINKWQRQLTKKDLLGRPIAMELLEGHVQIEDDRIFRCRTCSEWVEFRQEVE